MTCNTSPTDHAWNRQPRGVRGGSPSAISDTCPRLALFAAGVDGIDVFTAEVLMRELSRDARRDTCHDFGKNLIPHMVENGQRVGGVRK
jgi:hypothetical protein